MNEELIVNVAMSAGGVLIGCGVAWGLLKKTVGHLNDGHKSLRTEFVNHKYDRRIHIDPERDAKVAALLQKTIDDGFALVNRQLSVLNSRCENRGTECAGHFTSIEKKIAAKLQDPNGD